MANYVGLARSNYFKVKSVEEFSKFCNDYHLRQIGPKADSDLVGFVSEDEGGLYLPEDEGRDFYKDLASQLAVGHVAIINEIGYEKMRYLTGQASAVNWKGETKFVDLTDIFIPAREMAGEGVDVTDVCY